MPKRPQDEDDPLHFPELAKRIAEIGEDDEEEKAQDASGEEEAHEAPEPPPEKSDETSPEKG